MSEHKIRIDVQKMAGYIQSARHYLNEVEKLMQEALLRGDIDKVEKKVKSDNGAWP